MAELVNLNRERKRRRRAEVSRQAAANRIAFGTPPSLRAEMNAARDRENNALDGKQRATLPSSPVPEPDPLAPEGTGE